MGTNLGLGEKTTQKNPAGSLQWPQEGEKLHPSGTCQRWEQIYRKSLLGLSSDLETGSWKPHWILIFLKWPGSNKTPQIFAFQRGWTLSVSLMTTLAWEFRPHNVAIVQTCPAPKAQKGKVCQTPVPINSASKHLRVIPLQCAGYQNPVHTYFPRCPYALNPLTRLPGCIYVFAFIPLFPIRFFFSLIWTLIMQHTMYSILLTLVAPETSLEADLAITWSLKNHL